MPASREIFRNDDLAVRLVPRARRGSWVVTFDSHSGNRSLDRPGFGEEFFAAKGISAAHVIGRGNHWYQYPGTAAALAKIRRRLARARRVVTYGSSMGGYAALRFAAMVGADAALALSPQYSINRARMPDERRWGQEASSIDWQPDLEGPIAPVGTMVVAYDPREADAAHVARIAAEVPIVPIALPFVGHPVTTFLSAHQLLKPLILDLIEDTLDVAAFHANAMAIRRSSPVYLSELASRQPRSRPRVAIALGRRALAAAPTEALFQSTLAQRLTQVGAHDEALPLHAQAVAASNGFSSYVYAQAEALLAAGDPAAARVPCDALVAADPENAVFLHLRARVAAAQGDKAAAQASKREAARLVSAQKAQPRAPGIEGSDETSARGLRRALERLRTMVGRPV